MFIKKTKKTVKGKTYYNHLLVESVSTPKGPRHRVVCSLGSLEPGPREEWRTLAQRLAQAVGPQADLFGAEGVDELLQEARAAAPSPAAEGTPTAAAADDQVEVCTDQVEVEKARAAGAVHVGHQMWERLGLDGILSQVGFDASACRLTEVMTLNRLIAPCSEHAMPAWVERTALGDILGDEVSAWDDNALYRHLDRLPPHRVFIEAQLAARERSLFELDEALYIYDLTSTYFEGQCAANPQAQRGYSRDKRPDCKQVVVGLVIDAEGFPKAHEVFPGNRTDSTTVDDMLVALERRTGRRQGATVIVDRGMAFDENIEAIQQHQHHYIVACRQPEREAHLDAFVDGADWKAVERTPSPTNPFQRKEAVWVKQRRVGDELHVLCRSEARARKDAAIRTKKEQRLQEDLDQLARRIAAGRLVDPDKIHQAIGRLRERHSRVARYHVIAYDRDRGALTWERQVEAQQQAEQLDGTYLLKTDRLDLSDDEVWRTYSLLTRVEAAFRTLKSPLQERPIFHHLQHRVQAHIFLCVLAYHLLVTIEKHFLDQGLHTSWATLRQQLETHQVVTVALQASDGRRLTIRRATRPEDTHQHIYRTLDISPDIMEPIKTWQPPPAP